MARVKTTRTQSPRKSRKAPAQAAASKTESAVAKVASANTAAAKQAVAAGAKVAAETAKTAADATRTPASSLSMPKAAGADGKAFNNLVAVGQDNLEAYMTCGSIVAKGLEILGKEVMAVTHAGLEENVTATRKIMAAKSLREVIDVQTGFTQFKLERMADEAARFSALSLRVASQAMQPLQGRIDAGVRLAARPFEL